MAASRSTASFPRPDEIFSQLQKGPPYPLYLFHGDEPYLVDQAVTLVRERIGKAAVVYSFYAGEDSLDALLDAWGTPSLFTPQSLVVLKSAELLKAADRERLAKETEFRNETQPLVVCAHGRVDLRQTFFALCTKKGFVAEFRPPFPNQVVEWAQRDRQKALGLLRRVFTDEREALPILHALVGHFRRLGLVKELAGGGKPEEEIAQTVGLRGQRLRLLLSQSRLYTVADLQRFWHRVTALDLALKSSRTAPRALLEALVLEMCTRPSSRPA